MANVDLKEYLKQIVSLEGSIYRQEKINQEARYKLGYYNPESICIDAPQKPQDIQPPALPRPTFKRPGISQVIFSGVAIVLGILFIIIKSIMGVNVAMLGGPLIMLGIIIIALWGYIYSGAKKTYNEEMEEYAREWLRYKKEKESREKTYEEEMDEYQRAMQKYEQDVSKASSDYEKNYTKAKSMIRQMDTNLKETKRILKNLYELDVVFPKYRNIVAMCSIYEYIAAGRCTELEGPNGAYNLYEAELRQNLIINKLEEINRNLKAIQSNQYMLYQELTQLNHTMDRVAKDIAAIRSATNEIRDFSAVTAHCASVTATNTTALKYLALVN